MSDILLAKIHSDKPLYLPDNLWLLYCGGKGFPAINNFISRLSLFSLNFLFLISLSASIFSNNNIYLGVKS